MDDIHILPSPQGECVHNFIYVTKSTRWLAPYSFCSKCGVILEEPQPTAARPPIETSTTPTPPEAQEHS